jgi:HSP20 family protein
MSSYSYFGDQIFDAFRRLQQDLDEFVGRSPWPSEIRGAVRGAYPPINVASTPEKVDVYLFAAGLDPKSLDISLHRQLLTVAGERKLGTDQEAQYYRRERFEGEFRRAITLPEDVDPDRVQATYRDGILQISVQRREAARPRQISIQ